MNEWISNLHLSSKTTLIVFVTSTIALILATGFVAFYQNGTARTKIEEQTRTAALQVGASSRAALLYRDKNSARRYLNSFSINSNVLVAAFLLEGDEVFVEYRRAGNDLSYILKATGSSFMIENNFMHLVEPVFERAELLGYIYVIRDLDDVATEISNTISFMLFVLAICTIVALVFGSQMQRIITVPFENLLGVTKAIRQNQDYQVRARKSTNDELGELADSFNLMLEEIETRDQDLKISEAWFRGIIENSSEFVCVLDHNHHLAYINPVLERLIGASAIGQMSSKYVDTSQLDLFMDVLERSISQAPNSAAVNELRLLTKTSETVYVDLSVTCLYGILGIDGLVIHGRDVTERLHASRERERLIEELEHKNAELESFTYTVSHDLKSPLVTINGFAGLLKKDIEQNRMDRLDQDIECIQTAAQTMQKQLQELLDLSRIGRVMNDPEPVSLKILLENTCAYLAGPIGANGVEIEFSDDIPWVYGDPVRLLQVIQNLIENGVKFIGDQPKPVIKISSTLENDFVCLRIQDNGIGIDSKYLDKIFGLFDRLDSKTEGTGIGLSLVKRIVEVHGGKIWAESEGLGLGTAFYLKLPHYNGVENEI